MLICGYNITGNIIAGILFILLWIYVGKRYPGEKMHNFIDMVIWLFIMDVTDLIAIISIYYNLQIALIINTLMLLAYNMALISICRYFNSFVVESTAQKARFNSLVRTAFTIYALNLCFNYFYGNPFRLAIKNVSPTPVFYIPILVYVALAALYMLIRLIRHRKDFDQSILYTYLFCICMICLAPILQVNFFRHHRMIIYTASICAWIILFVLETPHTDDIESSIESIKQSTKEISKINMEHQHNIYKTEQNIQNLSDQLIHVYGKLLDLKDAYTKGHCERVAEYAKMIAQKMNLSDERIEEIFMEAYLHDIGKILIPKSILNKQGSLTPEEELAIRSHTTEGAKILSRIKSKPNLLHGAKYHHENYDGTGYPDGLKGEAIPQGARIISVADAYDTMASTRCYRPVMEQDAIVQQLFKGKGTQFDPEIADIMITIINEDTEFVLQENPSDLI